MSININRNLRKIFEILNLSPISWNIFWNIFNNTMDDKDTTIDIIYQNTGFNKGSIYRAIKAMENRKIIIFKGKRAGFVTINKILHEWILKEEKVNKEKIEIVNQQLPTGDIKYRATPGFQRFIAAYPKKYKIMDAVVAWNKLNPNEELEKIIIKSVEDHKKTKEWQRENGKWIPYPVNFIIGKRWLDKIEGDTDWTQK